MSVGAAKVTAEDLLAMPDDGIERWIRHGELREGGMTIRNFWHSEAESLVVAILWEWLRKQPRPRGTVCSGEVGIRLVRDPELTVGIDVAFLGPELMPPRKGGSTIVDGIPRLAVEILSPSDKQEEVEQKIDDYLAAGVPQVWEVNPRRRTVTVYRPNQEPVLFNVNQDLIASPELPGFQVPVLSLFEDTSP